MTSSNDTLTCQELIDFLADYLSGELAPHTVRVFDTHLAGCADCVAYVDSYRKAVEVTKKAVTADSALAQNAPSELIQAILAARPKSKP